MIRNKKEKNMIEITTDTEGIYMRDYQDTLVTREIPNHYGYYNDAGEYAIQTFLNQKSASHPEAAGWGTPQMIPRIINGNAFACQYWDGIIALAENPKKSKTAGKWSYGLVPGSKFSGKLVHRSVSMPVVSIVVNRHSPRKAQMAHLAMYLATAKNSAEIVGDPVNTFHDPWHVDHFKPGSKPFNTYTAAGMNAIERNLKVTTPPIYLTGLLEFETELKRNISMNTMIFCNYHHTRGFFI